MTDSTSHSPKSARSSRVWRWLAAALVLVVCLAIFGVIQAGRQFDRMMAAGKQVEKEFVALAGAHPYTPPAGPTLPPAVRFEKMLAARDRLDRSLPVEQGQRIAALIGRPEGGQLALARELLALAPALKPAADSLAGALQAAEMNPLEYRHLLGILVRRALDRPHQFSVGQHYEAMIAGLEREEVASSRVGKTLNPAAIKGRLAANFPAVAPRDALVDRLEAVNPLTYTVDLLILTLEKPSE